MRNEFYIASVVVPLITWLCARFLNPGFYSFFLVIVPLILLGYYDIIQRRKTLLRNFPILGHFRYLLEMSFPKFSGHFLKSGVTLKKEHCYGKEILQSRV